MEEYPVVYIVDDDAAARDSLSAMVTSKGWTVKGYDSAEAFLAEFDRESFGCLLTDLRMAGMNGLELQQSLRKECCSIPVIVITGYGDVPSAVSAFRGGAITFMEKPCDAQELCSHIGKALEEYRERRDQEKQKVEIITRFKNLTDSERDVMAAMVNGKPNKVIASELIMGLRTVELRRANVLKKTKANSLAELVRMCVIHDDGQEENTSLQGELRNEFGY